MELKNVLTAEDLALLTDADGIVRARQRREEFHGGTARRYLRLPIHSLGHGRCTVAATANREPQGAKPSHSTGGR